VFANLTPSALGVTRGLLVVISCYLPLWSLLNAQFALSRAGGDMMMGIVADVGVTWILFIPAALSLAFLTGLGPVAMFAIVKSTDVAKYLACRWWLSRERWVVNLAKTQAPRT